MIKSDPLSFLDEPTAIETSGSDPLSFLDEYSPSQPSFQNQSLDENEDTTESLSFLGEPEEEPNQVVEKMRNLFTPQPRESDPNKSPLQNILDIYRPEEKSPEQLKSMTIQERMDYIQEMQNLRELQQATGFGKGALSGATLSASEYIPGLKPDEEDLMVGLGENIGAFLPISKLYNFIGKPLVNFASKSPIARQGLESLARMTGFGLTGATYEAGKDLVQGEVPTVEELAKTGATWAAIDGALQALGLGVNFGRAVRNIAEAEGKTAKQVLGELWQATKNFLGRRTISPDEILEPEIEALMDQAEKRVEEAIEVTPVEETSKPAEKAPKPEVKTDEQINSELTEAKKELSELEKTQGKGATKEKSLLIQKINELELEKHNRAKQVKPTEEKSASEPEEEIVEINEPEEAGEVIPAGKPGAARPEKSIIDERPILKALLDLKEQLAATKGNTSEARRAKSDLTRKIDTKTNELEAARDHNKSLEQPLTKDFGKPDVTSRGLKQQKQFIIDKIDEALANPPDTNHVTIDVPGDGIYRVNNDPRVLETVKKKVLRDWPVKGVKPTQEEAILPSETVEATEELPKKRQVPPRQTRPRQPVVGKKQAVARSKIIDVFRKAFTDPIRLGKISNRNAAGIHKLWPKVTRLIKDNDVETVAHEIGHNLHTTLYGGDAKTPHEQFKNIESALSPYLDELKPLAHYEPWGMEGFAEFTRLYVTNPDVALELARNSTLNLKQI